MQKFERHVLLLVTIELTIFTLSSLAFTVSSGLKVQSTINLHRRLINTLMGNLRRCEGKLVLKEQLLKI